MASNPNPRTVASNIIAEHGTVAFNLLIKMFNDHESGTKIGHVFRVSRQRVNQWKRILGCEYVTYAVHPEIVDLVKKPQINSNRTAI